MLYFVRGLSSDKTRAAGKVLMPETDTRSIESLSAIGYIEVTKEEYDVIAILPQRNPLTTKVDDVRANIDTLLGEGVHTRQSAEQFRRAVQMFAQSLTEDKAMEISMVFDAWQPGKSYAVDDLVTYGTNGVGDPQLYKVIQAHTSQADWLPDLTQSLYLAIGLDDAGYPVWSPPTGAHDAYNIGDITNYEGTLYESLIHGNTTIPGTDDRYWEVYKEVEV